jgi:hypothetical protein
MKQFVEKKLVLYVNTDQQWPSSISLLYYVLPCITISGENSNPMIAE